MRSFQVRPLDPSDRDFVARFTEDRWGSRKIVRKGGILLPEQLPGLVATEEGKIVGLLTYRVEGGECEVVTLNSLVEGTGIGSSLMDAVKDIAVSLGCRRLWLITTNDNLSALRFYQKWGLRLVAVYPNAVEQSRKLKPEIPLVGKDGIPLRDEVELETPL